MLIVPGRDLPCPVHGQVVHGLETVGRLGRQPKPAQQPACDLQCLVGIGMHCQADARYHVLQEHGPTVPIHLVQPDRAPS